MPNLVFGRGSFCSNESSRFEKSLLKIHALFKNINMGNQVNFKKCNQKLRHVEYYDEK